MTMSHFMRTAPCAALEPRDHAAQLSVWRGALPILWLPADAAGVAERAGRYAAGPDPALLPQPSALSC